MSIPSTADKVHSKNSNGTGLIPNDSLFSSSLRRELPNIMRVQTGVPQSLRENTKNAGSKLSRNLDLRLSTLTQPTSKKQQLRKSIDANVANSSKLSWETRQILAESTIMQDW